MPSSLTRVLSRALGFSPCLPVSVYGTVAFVLTRGFSWQCGIRCFIDLAVIAITPQHYQMSGFACSSCLRASTWYSITRTSYPSASPHRSNGLRRYRNINLFSIDYAFRPRLRSRLTLRRLALRRKPWVFGVGVFHPHYRYSCQHSHF